jgi:hypothetical protein
MARLHDLADGDAPLRHEEVERASILHRPPRLGQLAVDQHPRALLRRQALIITLSHHTDSIWATGADAGEPDIWSPRHLPITSHASCRSRYVLVCMKLVTIQLDREASACDGGDAAWAGAAGV